MAQAITATNRAVRELFDSVTLSAAQTYSLFGPTPSNSLPNNYQRNPLPFSVTQIHGIKASLNQHSLTPANATIMASGQLTITKNQVNILNVSLSTLFGIDNGGNFSATNQFVVFRKDFYGLGKDYIELKDTEPFVVTVTFGTAPANTDVLRIFLNCKTIDRLNKNSN